MAKEVTVYNEQDFRERVTNSVRSNFGMLIPEEEFDSLVQKEIKAYFEEKEEFVLNKVSSGWREKDFIEAYAVTPFRRQIWNEVESLIKEKMKKDLMDSAIANSVEKYWTGHGEEVVNWNEVVENMTKEIAPMLAEKMFERIVAEAVSKSTDAMRNEIMNTQGY